ncbi:integrating conjugative element protein, PFL family [Yersinia pseudotuberculosis]|nr:integrating conjugative element protein, PFL family [Yersinia pseudotuberculosis]
MTLTSLRHRRLLPLILLIGSSQCMANVNTASLIISAASASCISWKVKGICYWLLCTPLGCSVKTSVKVEHFIPEAVVSAYSGPGDNPWVEMAAVSRATSGAESGITGMLTGGGQQQMKAPGLRQQNLRYHYADAYGHPATSLMGGAYCRLFLPFSRHSFCPLFCQCPRCFGMAQWFA